MLLMILTIHRWDIFKTDCRDIIRTHCSIISSSKKGRLVDCEKELNTLMKDPVTNCDIIENIKKTINALHKTSRDGAVIIAKASYFDQGKKPTRYFIRREAARAEKKMIKNITCHRDGNVEHKCQKDISQCIRDYCKGLYAEEDTHADCQNEFLSGFPKLSTNSQAMCEGALTQE